MPIESLEAPNRIDDEETEVDAIEVEPSIDPEREEALPRLSGLRPTRPSIW